MKGKKASLDQKEKGMDERNRKKKGINNGKRKRKNGINKNEKKSEQKLERNGKWKNNRK